MKLGYTRKNGTGDPKIPGRKGIHIVVGSDISNISTKAKNLGMKADCLLLNGLDDRHDDDDDKDADTDSDNYSHLHVLQPHLLAYTAGTAAETLGRDG